MALNIKINFENRYESIPESDGIQEYDKEDILVVPVLIEKYLESPKKYAREAKKRGGYNFDLTLQPGETSSLGKIIRQRNRQICS